MKLRIILLVLTSNNLLYNRDYFEKLNSSNLLSISNNYNPIFYS